MSDGIGPAADDLASLDTVPADEFAAAIAPLFEGASGFVWRLDAARPFGSWQRLFERAREIAHAMPEPLQVELIDAHPRLGAPPGSVSAMSFVEQGYDQERAVFAAAEMPVSTAPSPADERHGLESPLDDSPPLAPSGERDLRSEAAIERERARIAAKLEYLNDRYEARFGFRYCVFVAGRQRSELIPEMAAALDRERESELHRALDAVIDIAADRRRASTGTVSA